MCGINGIFSYQTAGNAPDRMELLTTRDAMHARGPDSAGEWWSFNRRCALANRRLSILDLSTEAAMPMSIDQGKLVITFNGEIYNYRELRSELEAEGVIFRTKGDTEVLIQLYARRGIEMLSRLRGMFSFAIWDEYKNELILARDPYGIKPLYTANDGWTFRFSSQVKSLIAGGQISKDPEPAGVVGFYLFGHVPDPFTLYREVRALPAGHFQKIDLGGPHEPEPYFNFSGVLANAAETVTRPENFLAVVREALADSIHSHFVSDVEVGIFLSAGIDSGTLLGLAREREQGNIRTITLAYREFENTSQDERPLAEEVAKHYAANHTVRVVTKKEFLEDLPRILAAMDQPSIDGVNSWFIAKAAKELGIKVALSGLGADELFGGYPSFSDIPRWHKYFGAVAAVPGVGPVARCLLSVLFPSLEAHKPKALGLLDLAASWGGTYLLRRAVFLPHELSQIIDPAVANDGMRRLKPVRRLNQTLEPDPKSPPGRVCALESAHYMRDQLLRDADWAGMAHSVEIRVPYVDIPLLKAIAPFVPKYSGRSEKLSLAQIPSNPLPESVVNRTKTGFGVPFDAWLNLRGKAQDRRLTSGDISRHWSRSVMRSFE